MEMSENEVLCCDKCNKAFEQGDTFEVLLIKIDDKFREVRFHRACSPLKLPNWTDEWQKEYYKGISQDPLKIGSPSGIAGKATITYPLPYPPPSTSQGSTSQDYNSWRASSRGSNKAANLTATELVAAQKKANYDVGELFKSYGLNSDAIDQLLNKYDEEDK